MNQQFEVSHSLFLLYVQVIDSYQKLLKLRSNHLILIHFI